MQSFVPSFPYPPAGNGVWSPITSTLNWCEEDYYASIYCAEVINSFTNLAFVYLAYRGISNCIRNGHDSVFLVGFISYLIIGLGSFCFHTTLKCTSLLSATIPAHFWRGDPHALKDETQLLDELAMIYTTSVMCYSIFSHGRSTMIKLLVALFVIVLAVFITLYYHYLKDPTFHQNAFALFTAIVFFYSIYVMEATLRPSLRPKTTETNAADQKRRDQRDTAILKVMWQMIPVGLGSVALGFLIWNLDIAYCPVLRRWRRQVGLPWGILLEGHGWWHIFTGIAQYFNITWSIWLRYCLRGEQDIVELVWPSLFTSIPVLQRKNNGTRHVESKRPRKIE